MIRIYGVSDDLVEIEGDVEEEIGCYDKAVTLEVGGAKGGLRVVAEYAPRHASSDVGVWRLGVEPIDEDVPIPWPVRVELAERGYSPVINIDCPPGTPVQRKGAKP